MPGSTASRRRCDRRRGPAGGSRDTRDGCAKVRHRRPGRMVTSATQTNAVGEPLVECCAVRKLARAQGPLGRERARAHRHDRHGGREHPPSHLTLLSEPTSRRVRPVSAYPAAPTTQGPGAEAEARTRRSAATMRHRRGGEGGTASLLTGDAIPVGIEVMDVGSHNLEVPRGELRAIDVRRIDGDAGARVVWVARTDRRRRNGRSRWRRQSGRWCRRRRDRRRWRRCAGVTLGGVAVARLTPQSALCLALLGLQVRLGVLEGHAAKDVDLRVAAVDQGEVHRAGRPGAAGLVDIGEQAPVAIRVAWVASVSRRTACPTGSRAAVRAAAFGPKHWMGLVGLLSSPVCRSRADAPASRSRARRTVMVAPSTTSVTVPLSVTAAAGAATPPSTAAMATAMTSPRTVNSPPDRSTLWHRMPRGTHAKAAGASRRPSPG